MVELLLALLMTATGIDRTVDAELMAMAQERAAYQVTFSDGQCDGDGALTHEGSFAGTAEVLYCHPGSLAPATDAVEAWMASPDHAAILLDADYGLIGCGHAEAGIADFFACVLTGPAAEAVVASPKAPAATPLVKRLPDAAQGRSLLPVTIVLIAILIVGALIGLGSRRP